MRHGTFIGMTCATLVLVAAYSPLCVAQPAPATVVAKFAGTWKEDPAKRVQAAPPLHFRMTAGKLEELRGPEARPLVQPVNFEAAKPYSIDGSPNSIAWKKVDARHFERRLYRGEKLLNTRKIEISADGKTLTQIVEWSPSDIETDVYTRNAGGGEGLAGTWKIDSIRMTQPAEMKISAQGADGIRISHSRGNVEAFRFDGKPAPVTGPAVISGTMAAGRIVDANTIEMSSSREGVDTATTTMVLSNGGKTQTVTSRPKGGGETMVWAYNKQP